MRIRSFPAGATALLLLACGSTDPAAQAAQDESSETAIAAPAHGNEAPDACLASDAKCDTAADACCAGTRCVEYTVYDWPRCRAPKPTGSSCWNPLECATGKCVQGVCAPDACLAPDAKCDTAADACCAGTRCVEYTVYDWPRCRAPKPAGSSCSSPLECATGKCVQGVCAQ